LPGIAVALVTAVVAISANVGSASRSEASPRTLTDHQIGAPSSLQNSAPVTYESDGFSAKTCSGTSSALQYVVTYPTSPGPHPIVFATRGSGFAGTANCTNGKPFYLGEQKIMNQWAAAGYVAVNIEYHGFDNGLYGDLTYPGPGKWGTTADGTVELDVKPAINYFLSHDPGQYGADPSTGVVLFGGSSGGNDAYMVALTGIPGYTVSAVIGWSAQLDVAASVGGRNAFDKYMQTKPNTDVEHFADPFYRLTPTAPPQYGANGLHEIHDPATVEDYMTECRAMQVKACWERILDTSLHGEAYAFLPITGQPPEIIDPAAQPGATVIQDSISFANQFVS
jgi:hypothetical protein